MPKYRVTVNSIERKVVTASNPYMAAVQAADGTDGTVLEVHRINNKRKARKK